MADRKGSKMSTRSHADVRQHVIDLLLMATDLRNDSRDPERIAEDLEALATDLGWQGEPIDEIDTNGTGKKLVSSQSCGAGCMVHCISVRTSFDEIPETHDPITGQRVFTDEGRPV